MSIGWYRPQVCVEDSTDTDMSIGWYRHRYEIGWYRHR